jgi:hypothetical protein
LAEFPTSIVILITKFSLQSADLIDMITLLLLFAFQVTNPAEMACIGSIQETKVPEDVYVAGVEGEGMVTLATAGQIVYLNGSGVSALKIGTVQRVVRLEGRVRHPLTRAGLGSYYKDIGTVQIEAVAQEGATARVLLSCEGMLKGDLVVPIKPKPVVEFSGSTSNLLTPIPPGLTGFILLARDDARELAAGHFCFIQLGKRDGVKPGDQFIVFRPYPAFEPKDMVVGATVADSTYSPMRNGFYRYKLDSILSRRTLPPKILGDIVIVEVGEGISTGKIINSLSEMAPGDLVVKK